MQKYYQQYLIAQQSQIARAFLTYRTSRWRLLDTASCDIMQQLRPLVKSS